jgi:uncharacterized protein
VTSAVHPKLAAGVVFAMPVADGMWLLHAPLARVSALVNGAMVRRLRAALMGQGAALPPEFRDILDGAGMQPLPRSGQIEPLFLGLLPTRACNMGCGYCGFGSSCAPDGVMDPRIAARAIDWAADTARQTGAGVLEVHLFGGEPLLAMDLVDIIVHHTRAAAAARGLRPVLETATNGVCAEPVARFVGDYFDTVILSFDGLPDVQDHCRPLRDGGPSSDRVSRSARIWSASPAQFCIRICVTRQNVGALPGTAEWMAREFEPSVIACETIQPTPESRRAGLAPPDALAFARAFREARCRCRELGVEVLHGAAAPGPPRATLCPVGQDAVIVSPDGRISACYLEQRDWRAVGLDLDFGQVTPDGVVLNEAALRSIRELAAPYGRCEECFCRWSCAGGCHVSHDYPGRDDDFTAQCRQTRLISACQLLDDLGAGAQAAALLADEDAANRLATHRPDRIAGTHD